MDAQGQAGGRETVDGGVVLRFPGDWVGPLEELVPFGPAADRELSPAGPDFWGEDSAALQDAVEAPEARRPPEPQAPHWRRAPRQPLRISRWVLPVGAVLAAALFALAAVLGASPSSTPHVRGVTFATASIPPLAPTAAAIRKRPARRVRPARARRHPASARSTVGSASANTTSSPATTPSATYHPASATSSGDTSSSTGSPSSATSPSTAGNGSSQSGGAFTLGGP